MWQNRVQVARHQLVIKQLIERHHHCDLVMKPVKIADANSSKLLGLEENLLEMRDSIMSAKRQKKVVDIKPKQKPKRHSKETIDQYNLRQEQILVASSLDDKNPSKNLIGNLTWNNSTLINQSSLPSYQSIKTKKATKYDFIVTCKKVYNKRRKKRQKKTILKYFLRIRKFMRFAVRKLRRRRQVWAALVISRYARGFLVRIKKASLIEMLLIERARKTFAFILLRNWIRRCARVFASKYAIEIATVTKYSPGSRGAFTARVASLRAQRRSSNVVQLKVSSSTTTSPSSLNFSLSNEQLRLAQVQSTQGKRASMGSIPKAKLEAGGGATASNSIILENNEVNADQKMDTSRRSSFSSAFTTSKSKQPNARMNSAASSAARIMGFFSGTRSSITSSSNSSIASQAVTKPSTATEVETEPVQSTATEQLNDTKSTFPNSRNNSFTSISSAVNDDYKEFPIPAALNPLGNEVHNNIPSVSAHDETVSKLGKDTQLKGNNTIQTVTLDDISRSKPKISDSKHANVQSLEDLLKSHAMAQIRQQISVNSQTISTGAAVFTSASNENQKVPKLPISSLGLNSEFGAEDASKAKSKLKKDESFREDKDSLSSLSSISSSRSSESFSKLSPRNSGTDQLSTHGTSDSSVARSQEQPKRVDGELKSPTNNYSKSLGYGTIQYLDLFPFLF
jgi:hypothetical protein